MSMCPVCNNPIDSQAPVCPHCGFKLLGSTQRFEPVSFGDDALPVAAAPQAAAALHVVRGPQTGVTYQLGDQALTIGRSPQCDLFLNDMTVSREHASVEPADGGYVIRDANSFNGVWVNNESVETSSRSAPSAWSTRRSRRDLACRQARFALHPGWQHAQNARRSARFWTFDRGGRCALPYNSPVGLSHGRVRSGT